MEVKLSHKDFDYDVNDEVAAVDADNGEGVDDISFWVNHSRVTQNTGIDLSNDPVYSDVWNLGKSEGKITTFQFSILQGVNFIAREAHN